MKCPRCRNILLFPDQDDGVSRERLCAICGWTQPLDCHGQPLATLKHLESYQWDELSIDHNGRGWRVRDGCAEVAPSCLACPLPKCKDEDYSGYLDWLKQQRGLAPWGGQPPDPMLPSMRQAVRAEAERLGVSTRNVYRWLARHRARSVAPQM